MVKQGNKASLKPQIVDGELVHFVTVGGQPILGHLSLRTALCAVVSAMELGK